MKKYLALLVLLGASLLHAQTTAVTATITYPDTQALAGAVVTVQFVAAPGGGTPASAYRLNGSPFTQLVTATANSSGAFSMTLTDDRVATPSDGSWLFTVCVPVNTPCFSVTQNVTGASLSLSTQLSVAAKPVGGQSLGIPVYYTDAEATAFEGATYLNYVTHFYRCYANGIWINCSTAGGGGVSGSGTATFIPVWTAATVLGNSGCTYASSILGCPAYNVNGTGPWTINTAYGGTPNLSSAGNSSISVDPVNGSYAQSVNGGAYVDFATITQATPGCSPNAIQVNVAGAFGCASQTDDNTTPVKGPHGYDVQTQGFYAMEIANNTVTGTVLNALACDDGTGKVIVCPHATSTTNLGVDVTANAGSTGNATVSVYGFLPIFFDNAATALHYAIESSTTDGYLHDTGSTTAPTTGQPYYLVWVSNSGANTVGYIRVLTPEDLNAAGTGGGGTQVQVNGAAARREINFNSTTPAVAGGHLNLPFNMSSSGNLSSANVSPAVSGNASTLATAGAVSGTGSVCGDGSGNVTTSGCSSGATTLIQIYVNDGTTGTLLNKIVKVNASSVAILAGTADTPNSGYAGICVSGCGTTGNATVQYAGTASCIFSNGVTQGHVVTWSGAVAGACLDAGSFNNQQPSNGTPIIGRVNSPTNAVAGTYLVDLAPNSGQQDTNTAINAIMAYKNGTTVPIPSNLSQTNLGTTGTGGAILVNSGAHLYFQATGGGTGSQAGVDMTVCCNLVLQGDSPNHGQVKFNTGTFGVSDTTSGAVNWDLASIHITSFSGSGSLPFINLVAGEIPHAWDLCQNGTGHFHMSFVAAAINPPLIPDAPNACTHVMMYAVDTTHVYFIGASPVHPAALTGQVAALSDTVLTHPMAATLIHVGGSVNCTTTSAAATATLNIKYTDTASTVQTVSVTDTCTALVTSGVPNVDFSARVKADTDVTYGVTIANTPTYDVDVSVRAEQ